MNTLFSKDISLDSANHLYKLTSDPGFNFTSSTQFISQFFDPNHFSDCIAILQYKFSQHEMLTFFAIFFNAKNATLLNKSTILRFGRKW